MWVPLGAALTAWLIVQPLPLVSPLLVALVMGVVVANSVLRKSVVGRSDAGKTRQLLRAGIVLLGFRMQWSDIVDIGIAGLAVIVLTVVATYWLTMWMGRILGLERGLVSLIAAGFSICGAAAIAMMQDELKVKQRDVGYALALVTAYGTVYGITTSAHS